MKKCFLFHDWKQTHIKEDRNVIGKVPDTWEEGIYKVEIITTEIFKCIKCGKEKKDVREMTKTHRQYYK